MKTYKIKSNLFKGFELDEIIYPINNGEQYGKNDYRVGDTCIPFEVIKALPEFFEPSEYLFVTKDGVNIYNGDKYWYVTPQFCHFNSIARESNEIEKGVIYSTSELCTTHIDQHKPKYSLIDICNAIGNLSCLIEPSKLLNNLKSLNK